MPTEAAAEAVVNVVEDEATPEEVASPEATPTIDEATWKRRIAGKDQALTAAQRERDQVKAELASLRSWKAERENADLTEVERITLERDTARAEAVAAKVSAERARLAAKYPLATALFEDDDPLPPEERLAVVEEHLGAIAPKGEPAPRVDPNQAPRRVAPPPTGIEATKAQLKAELDAYFGR